MFPAWLQQRLDSAASSVVVVLFLSTVLLLWPNRVRADDHVQVQPTSQSTSAITSPTAGSHVRDRVLITGTATSERFAKYEVHYKPTSSSDDGYIYLGGATVPIINDQLATWETSDLPDGAYTLRLRVVSENGNYVEYVTPDILVRQDVATPDATETPEVSAAQEHTAASSAASSVGETAHVVTAALPAPHTALTVTITGGDEPGATETFLRYLLAGYAPQSGNITATIGALPDNLLLDIPLPDEAVVLGGYVRDGEFADSMLLISVAGSLDDFVQSLWESFMAQGYTLPMDDPGRGVGQVFLSRDSTLPDMLCSPDGDFVIRHSRAEVSGAPPVLRLNLGPVPVLYGPCTPTPTVSGPAYGILPQLLPPPDAQIQTSGGGGGSNSVAAEAEIRTQLNAAELAAHYNAQLEAAGWEALGESSTETIAWSAWRFHDDQEILWSGTFFIVQLGDASGTFLATLRADAVASAQARMTQPRADAVREEADTGSLPSSDATADASASTEASSAEYYYTKSEGMVRVITTSMDETFTALVTQTREFWKGTDGSGRIRQQYSDPRFFTPADQAAWEEAGSPGMISSMDQTFGPGELSLGYLDEMPSDAAELAQKVQDLAEATDNPLAWQMFDYVGSLLREMPHTLEVRQALFQVGSEIEGAEVTRQSEDRLGRPAIALSLVGTMNEIVTRRTLYFEPESYRLLGEEEVLLEPTRWFDAEPGTTIGWITYLHSGYVDSTTRVPQAIDAAQLDDLPTPQSTIVAGFVTQIDGEFGYQMLRPRSWTPVHLGTARGYRSTDMADAADRVLLTVAGLEALAATTPEGSQLVPWLEFQQSSSVEEWLEQREAFWQRSAETTLLSFERLLTLPTGALYALQLPAHEQLQLIAYVVDGERPLAISLEGFGRYSQLETLEDEGIVDDFVTMLESAHGIVHDPEKIEPALTATGAR